MNDREEFIRENLKAERRPKLVKALKALLETDMTIPPHLRVQLKAWLDNEESQTATKH